MNPDSLYDTLIVLPQLPTQVSLFQMVWKVSANELRPGTTTEAPGSSRSAGELAVSAGQKTTAPTADSPLSS